MATTNTVTLKPRRPYSLAVVVGRFQPVHIGHLQLLEGALEVADNVLILVGSTQESRTEKNPFTFTERESMLSTVLAKYADRVSIKPLPDKESVPDWLLDVHLNILVESRAILASKASVFVVNDKDLQTTESNSLLETLGYDVLRHIPSHSCSATGIRQALSRGITPKGISGVPKEVCDLLSEYWENYRNDKFVATIKRNPFKKLQRSLKKRLVKLLKLD